MKLVDIHSHLDFKQFDSDREELVNKMREKEILALSNTINRANYNYTKELFKNSLDVVTVLPGLYPLDAENILDTEFNNYLNEIRQIKDLVAIGEVGLDLKHGSSKENFAKQMKRFRSLIELGIELDKPLIVHTWGAEKEVLDIVEEYVLRGFRKIVLHCFMGKKKLMKKICELEIYVSIPLTILNTQSFQILVEELPVSRLLVETDSPFLNPDKKRNSPLNIPKIYDKIAEIKGYDKSEIKNIIYRNYQKLF